MILACGALFPGPSTGSLLGKRSGGRSLRATQKKVIVFMKTVGSLVEAARAGNPIPDRHDNPYVREALELEDVLFTPSDFEKPAEHPFWRSQTPLFVEVGTYMGKNLIEMAQAMPKFRFLGLDITYKRTVKTARKIRRASLHNAAAGICDARNFFPHCSPVSVAGVCVFFPDPWPKKRHAKNRLVRHPFLEELERCLSTGGFLWLKTDSKPYFEEACADARSRGWTTDAGSTPQEFGERDFITVFEELFARKGEPTYSCVLRPPQS